MKIGIIDHVGIKAGMDYYSSSLAKGLVNKNSKVNIFSNFSGIFSEKINYKKFYEGHNNKNKLLKLFNLIFATIKSSYISKKENTDLIIIHLFATDVLLFLLVLIPKIFGLKVAVISHDVSSFANNDNKTLQNLIYNKLSDYIVVHNNFSYNELLKNIDVSNNNKVKIIKHGGYLDHINKKMTKEEYREKLNLDIDGKYILFFGQIKQVKGLDVLIEAMAAVNPDIKLIIAGKPWKDDFEKYDQMISKYKLQNRIIKMIHFIEDEDREKLFFASDINVLPYRTIYQSGVLLMAMSHGLPVIASNLEANKEIIHNNINGSLFVSEDANDLSNNINNLFNDKELLDKISINSLNTIEKDFSWDDIANEYISLINKEKI